MHIISIAGYIYIFQVNSVSVYSTKFVDLAEKSYDVEMLSHIIANGK
jgi:hypothetical protein